MAERTSIGHLISDLLFPPRCPACGTLLDWYAGRGETRDALCPTCLSDWQKAKDAPCDICGNPVSECRCMPMLMQEAKCAGFCKSVFYSPHQGDSVQSRMIYHIKRRDERGAPAFLCRELLPAVEQMLGEVGDARENLVVTFIPRRKNAKAEFGVDQAELLAREMAKLTGKEVRPLIRRTAGSFKAQKLLSSRKRIENAARAFAPNERLECRGKSVLLMDDLVTTGASMARCAKLLYRMGARSVFCAAVATDIPDPAETAPQ